MNINKQIELALKEHDDAVMASNTYKSFGEKRFIIKQVHYAVENLLTISKTIRENINRHGRVSDNIIREMLSWGQSFSSFLWLANIRNKVVDPIEYAYGISFSSLSIHPAVIDKTDGKTAFVFYNPRSFNSGDKYTLVKDGVMYFINLTEFDANYKKV